MEEEDPVTKQVKEKLMEHRSVFEQVQRRERARMGLLVEGGFNFERDVIDLVVEKYKDSPEQERTSAIEEIDEFMTEMKHKLILHLDRVRLFETYKPGEEKLHAKNYHLSKCVTQVLVTNRNPLDFFLPHRGEEQVRAFEQASKKGMALDKLELERVKEIHDGKRIDCYQDVFDGLDTAIDLFLENQFPKNTVVVKSHRIFKTMFMDARIKRRNLGRKPQSRTLCLPQPGRTNWTTWSTEDVDRWLVQFIKNKDHLKMIRSKRLTGKTIFKFMSRDYKKEKHLVPFATFVKLKSNFNRVYNTWNGCEYDSD